MKQVVIIPTIDPSGKIINLVEDLKADGFNRIVVVDDGSDKSWAPMFRRLERDGCLVVHHGENRGKGVAIKTGVAAMRKAWPDAPAFVTVDGDGQHLPADVRRVVDASERNPGRLVLGSRDFHAKGVPARSRFGNAFSSLYFRLNTGVKCPDTQTGLRVVPAMLFSEAEQCPGERYEYEMNFLTRVVRRGVPLLMVSISTVYEDGNAGSHFRTLQDSYRIYQTFFRFALASMTCAAADILLFWAADSAFALALSSALAVMLATVVARCASGVLNFTMNRVWSFRASPGSGGRQAARYFVLFVAQMAASGMLVALVSVLLPAVLAKVIVDSCLFVVSYFVQRNWVFSDSAPKSRGMLVAPAERGGSHAITQL